MSRHSAKSAGRSSKTPRRAVKKSAKSARGVAKTAAKSQRRRSIVMRAPSVAPQMAIKKPAQMILTQSPPMQPVGELGLLSQTHKYQIGEMVYYTSPTFGRAAATGSYTVVKLLPSEGDDHQYRIKSSGEAFERVAKESQLDRA
jgi:hypothetical protein